MHEHNTCEHEIKYCRICNVCYCEKCSRQWYNYEFTMTYGNTNPNYVSDGVQWTPLTYGETLRHTHEG